MHQDISTIVQKEFPSYSFRFSLQEQGKEIAHAYLYLIRNDLHEQPYGFLEDVFVEEAFRGRGNGERMVRAVIDEAKKQGCYKLLATSRSSRTEVHALYGKLGFREHGKEFRMEW